MGKSTGARYYLAHSAAYDYPPYEYDTVAIMCRVSDAGGRDVGISRAFGWYNQPDVVTWEGDDETNEKIREHLSSFPPYTSDGGLPVPIIRECNHSQSGQTEEVRRYG